MHALEVFPARFEDADRLAGKLRQVDRREIQAATGEEPVLMLRQGISWSDPCYTITTVTKQPVAMFGVVPDSHTPDLGRIWLLGSDELVGYSHTFLRHSRQWLEKLHQRYRTLWNYVDARNEVHIRWLKWCGFTFLRRIEEYGVERRPFYEFERVAEVTPAPPRRPDD